MKKVIKWTRERKKTRTAVRGNTEKGTGNQGLKGRLTMAKWKEKARLQASYMLVSFFFYKTVGATGPERASGYRRGEFTLVHAT